MWKLKMKKNPKVHYNGNRTPLPEPGSLKESESVFKLARKIL
jgi:hypothetical protein